MKSFFVSDTGALVNGVGYTYMGPVLLRTGC